MSGSTTIVDDQSKEILYHGQWNNLSPVNGAVGQTLSQATHPGSSFDFQFQGTAVYVYGMIQANTTLVVANYTLDGSTPFTGQSWDTTSNDSGETMFFSMGGLNSSQHLLHVDIIQADNSNPYYLDFVAFDPISSSAMSSATFTSLPVPTATQQQVILQTSSSTPVGAIVGGVVGGVAGLLIVAAVLFYLFFWRRRPEQAYFYKSADAAEMVDDQEVKPFPPSAPFQGMPTTVMLPPSVPAPASDVGGSQYSSSSGGAPHARPSYVSTTVGSSSVVTYASPNQVHSKAAEAGLLSVAQPATYYADSGVRFGSAGQGSSSTAAAAAGPSHIGDEDVPTDVPPTYSEN